MGYVIGLILGIAVFIFQNFKPTSILFRVSFFVLSVVFFWSISFADVGFWNVFLIPFGESLLCFISAMIFPYSSSSARIEYMHVNGRDYYSELDKHERIGNLEVGAFKQTYERIIKGILLDIATTKDEFRRLKFMIYSNNFYPISLHTKSEVIAHLSNAIEYTSLTSNFGEQIKRKANKNFDLLFNAFVSLMSIHEEATKAIEKLRKE